MDSSDSQLIGNRYKLLNKLGEGGMGVIYRAFDRLNRAEVALKRVSVGTARTDPSPQGMDSTNAFRVALAHEFQTLASLRHPHVISVIDYGFDVERSPYFTMSYLSSARTIVETSQGQPSTTKLRLVLEMLQALAYVHRRSIIHRDLKPDNVLVTANGQVKVLDFGLALLSGHLSNEDVISGTITYMAPEVLMGRPATIVADLYAVGVIACEIFGGKHPFAAENPSQLVSRILTEPVNIHQYDIDERLAAILQRLLEKSPEGRFQDAYEVINRLCEALDQPMPNESIAIRESFLQAAQLVGRDTELKQLTDALGNALEGRGSTWIIGGESGVGKSRLLNELAIRALVGGALVLYGQGVLEGEYSYELWREPLRRLALMSELSDTEASILQQWVPDLGQLLERPVPEPPLLEGRGGQRRMIETIVSVFRRLTMPIVLILEDLHWVQEGFDVLNTLSALAHEMPLLIVGSYRDDERPGLPDELPRSHIVKLERFTEAGIQQLSMSMLGDVGNREDVIGYLKLHTEGNVFFLVEVVRALAEKAGRLSLVGQAPLPEEIVAGGIQQIIRRRLDHVPDSARRLLRAAAVAGRQLDLKVLRVLSDSSGLEDWLIACSNAAVLEVVDDNWRFSHNKLRDGLLATMAADERADFHRQIAHALETVYADNLDEYASLISEHLEHGGEPLQAAEWYVRSAKHAEQTYAPHAAVDNYRKALALWQSAPDHQNTSLKQQVDVYLGIGAMLSWQARNKEAVEAFRTALEKAKAADDGIGKASAWCGLADVQLSQRDLQSALASATQAELLAQNADARSTHARALLMKGWALFELGKMEEALALGEKLLALSEESHQPTLMADSLNLVGVVNMLFGQYTPAAQHFERALKIYQEVGNNSSAMALVNNLGAIALERGDYSDAATRYQAALNNARELRHRDAELDFMSNLGGALARLGDYPAARSILLQVIEISGSSEIEEFAKTYYYLTEAYLGENGVEAALPTAKRALALAQEHQSPEDLAVAWRVLGQTAAVINTPIDIASEAQPQWHDASACFTKSEQIAKEAGMEGERARTLREWAKYELQHGDATRGAAMWKEARDLFVQLTATFEAERMGDLPTASAG